MTQAVFCGRIGNVHYEAFDCTYVEPGFCELPLTVLTADATRFGTARIDGRVYCLPQTPFDRAIYFLLGLSIRDDEESLFGQAAHGRDRNDRPAVRGLVLVDGMPVAGAWLTQAEDGREFITMV